MFSIHAIVQFASAHEVLGYALLFFGVLLEGEFVLLIAGILAHLGAFPFWSLYLVGLGGIISKAIAGYSIGNLIYKKYPKSRFFKFVTRRVNDYLPQFKGRPFWSIFISKFIWGINHFVLIYCGYIRTKKWEFYKAEISSSLIWILEFLSVGYFFSFAAFSISHDIRRFTVIILLFIIGFVILQRFINFLLEYYETRRADFEEIHEE